MRATLALVTQPKKPAAKKPAARKAPAKRAPAKRKAGTRAAAGAAKKTVSAAAKKRADAAAARAKEEKATGRRLSAAKQQLRDSMIVARAAQGIGYEAIAAEADVTTRTVERVIAARRGVRSPLDDAPMQLLEELAVGLRLSIGDYEAMALAWFDCNQSASLGAKKAADETRARLATLMADVGKLPSNLELFRTEEKLRQIALRMVEVMRAVHVGEMSPEQAGVEFERMLMDRDQAQIGAAA